MKLKQYLSELATTKIDIYDKGKSATHWYLYFKTPSGLKYLVNAVNVSFGGETYIFTFQLLEDDSDLGVMKNVELKDRKEVFAVFSGVSQAFDIFVKEVKPKGISIEANEYRKKALYQKFVNHIVKKYPYEIDDSDPDDRIWRLKRTK